MEKFEIVQIKDKDREELKKFLIQEDSSFIERLSSRVNIEDYNNKIIKNATIYGVKVENDIVAIIAYYRNDYETNIAYLTYLCVNSKYRKNNLATKLLNIMVNDCIEKNFKIIRLETDKQNNIARKFYEKKGFIEYNEFNNSVFYEKKIKKLMILGGSRYIIPVIDIAHKLGCYVITCDYLPDNIAHKYSDEYANVSIIDKDLVLEKAKELKIDGIMSFACDPGVETAAYVAEKLNLPSCGSYESVHILQNKGLFRKFLTDKGFNVPNAKSYKNIDEALKDKDYFNWPVIVKPTDSAGSKGVTKVINYEDLKESIEKALKFSHSDEFIIEDFLEKKGSSSDCDSFSIDGNLDYISFSAQKFDENSDNPYVPSAYSWPSTISNENQEYLQNEIQRLLKLLNMKTSLYNIETRECTNGKAYIMECSPRGGGNRLSEMMKYVDNVDLITCSVKAALGEKIDKI